MRLIYLEVCAAKQLYGYSDPHSTEIRPFVFFPAVFYVHSVLCRVILYCISSLTISGQVYRSCWLRNCSLFFGLLVSSPKVHWSEGSLVRKVTGPNSNLNPYPNRNCNPIPNPKVMFDLRNKDTLNSFSYVQLYMP